MHCVIVGYAILFGRVLGGVERVVTSHSNPEGYVHATIFFLVCCIKKTTIQVYKTKQEGAFLKNFIL